MMNRLISIFKSSIAQGLIPKGWERVRVAFIPKPGRTAHCEPKDYRPISLTSFLLKTVERLLDFYIRKEILRRFPLHTNQHAYQMVKSTDTALHQLTQKVEKVLKDGEVALGTFMDIERAFDNTEFEVIASAARNRQMEGTSIKWIMSMLSSRTVETSVCGTSTSLNVTKGTPQGGILSPILWCMVIDSLLVELNQAGVFTQGYSDDVSSLTYGFSLSTVGDMMKNALKIVEEWCTARALRVNPMKTKVILFSRKKNVDRLLIGKLKLFGSELKLTSKVKYLVVIFDDKLTWIPHLEDKINKAIGIFWMCRNAFGRTWGLSPRAIWWIYVAVIRPILCHGCVVWWPRVDVGTAEKRLTKLQRLACLCMTGAMRTTASKALEALLCLPPLNSFIKFTAFNASWNIRCNGWWVSNVGNHGHMAIENLMADEELKMPSDQMRPQLMLEDNFECIIPER